MKKIFLMAAITMMAAVSVNVQNDHETKHEVAISYGAFSNSQIIDVFEEITGAMFGAKLENEKFFGPISAKCFYLSSRGSAWALSWSTVQTNRMSCPTMRRLLRARTAISR